MKVYLASPFFHQEEITMYEEAIRILREQNLNVFVPKEHTIPNAWDLPNNIWAENVFAVDYLAIAQCDVVVVLNFGMYSDSGTAWECGASFALGKKVINVLCGGDDTEYSLMMTNGTTATIDLEIFRTTQFVDIIEHAGREANEKIKQK